MERKATDTKEYRELVEVVGQVRRRWRLKLALRGLAALGVALLVAFLLSAFAVGEFGFAAPVVVTARVALAILFVALLVALVLPPLWKRVTDEQVALYLEEREPSLRFSLVSALAAGGADPDISPGLARRTIETAVQRCRKVEAGRRLESGSLTQSAGLIGGVVAVGLLLFLLSPNFVRLGARALFLPLPVAQAADVMRVAVAPGDTAVARGADLPVTAELFGFAGPDVDLYARSIGTEEFDRIPMMGAEDGSFELRLFNVADSTEYYVESQGVRSPVYRVDVLDLPYVGEMQVELIFPEYTGLEPQTIEDGGDIFAPVGTRVRLRATPTMPVLTGSIALEGAQPVELTVAEDGALTGEFSVRQDGLYHIELQADSSQSVTASPEYLIEVMDDAEPRVVFDDPGRDIKVTLVDEVYLEARATDDFGIRELELVYSVNGGPEQTLPLYAARPMPEVSAGHTFYLEELDLQAGDFIAYHARTVDVGPEPRKPISSDMYFVEIRPFGLEYRQADQPGGGGGGGGQQEEPSGDELTQRQRELISATFNVVRDRETFSDVDFRQNMEALAAAQAALRRQALTLAERLRNRGSVRDSSFDAIAESLPQAAEAMEEAVDELTRMSPDDALPPEQRALVHLQRVEAAFREVQVSLGAQGGSGGSSSSGMGPSAQDLADLFGLELDQMRNQYETVQRGAQQQAATEVDETIDRVRELARRLERENERLRQSMASQVQSGAGGGGQRQMAEEALEEARRLERLSREQSRPDLMEAAEQLREAAESMRRAAANERTGNTGDAQQALDRLREATRRLEREQAQGVQNQADDVARRAQRLAEEQRRIAQDMQNLPEDGASRNQRADDLIERKEQQAREVEDLESQLDRLATESRQEQPDASRGFRAAAETIRQNELPEQIRASRVSVRPNMPAEFGRRIEQEIQSGLDELRDRAQEASRSITTPNEQGERSLDQARDLVRGLESMQERLRQGQQDQPGQQGQPGEPGQ
ncbi:MAG: DUF4175 family protein, partial [Gemmatimonadota bacterium]